MSFQRVRWSKQSNAANTGFETVGGVDYNGPSIFSYGTADDSAATVAGANYFADACYDLAVGDLIFADCSDAFSCLRVSAVTRGDADTAVVTTEAAGFSTGIDTANIIDDAVTTAKIADGAVTSDKLDEQLVLHTRVSMSLATFIGAYTASAALVAAPGAGKKIILHRANYAVDYGGTVLANGGAFHIQYDSTANGAGTKATQTLAAATVIAATADTTFGFTPVDTTLVDSTTLNKGLYLGIATGDFTGGTGSTYEWDIWYSIIDLT